MLSTEICKVLKNTYFLKQLYLRAHLYLQCMIKKQLRSVIRRILRKLLSFWLWSTMIVFAITIQIATRSSHQRCSVRKDVLRNFTNFTGKQLCQSLFLNKVAGLRPASLLNTLALVFSCAFCEISRKSFFTEHVCWLLPELASLAKWLSVPLRTKWLLVRVQLQSIKLDVIF